MVNLVESFWLSSWWKKITKVFKSLEYQDSDTGMSIVVFAIDSSQKKVSSMVGTLLEKLKLKTSRKKVQWWGESI